MLTSWSAAQSVKDHLKGYEKGLADAETTPRTKELQMAVVQAKLKGYSEVGQEALTRRNPACVTKLPLHMTKEDPQSFIHVPVRF